MGTDRTQVYDQETDMEPTTPAQRIAEQITAVMAEEQDFTAARWYAMGRLHYEPTPYPELDEDTPEVQVPRDVDAALGFAGMYQLQMRAWRLRAGDSTTIEAAWERFVETHGASIF